MSIRRDIVANYFGAGIAAVAPVIALPWYLSILGTKNWGLISFISILQGLLSLLNSGLVQSLLREFSLLAVAGIQGRNKIAVLLFGFERAYWAFGLVAAVILGLFANVIVTYWIKLGDIPVETGRMVVYGAAAIFAVQFPVSIYRSVLISCNKQVTLNMLISAVAALRHAGGVVVLITFRSIYAYLVWNILAALVETLITARMGWGVLESDRSQLHWDTAKMKTIFSSSMWWTFAVMLSVLTTQVDKLVLSWTLPIEKLGFYTIASSVALGLLQLFSPIASAALPRVIQLHGQPQAQRRLNLKLFGIMLAIGGGVAIVFALAGETILTLWLHDKRVVTIVYPIMALLLVGTAINAAYNVGYMNWIAAGATKKVLHVNMASFFLSVLLAPILIAKYGLLGATFSWLSINVIGLILSLDWLAKGKGAHG